MQRAVDISEFNKAGSEYFAFIMTTRAGGLGVNLQTADTVILLDSDWNPQVDNQAIARCHRIGQTKPVHVYRLIASGTVEERMVARAQKKMFLDTVVTGGGGASAGNSENAQAELLDTLTFGVDRIFQKGAAGANEVMSDADIDAIIRRDETTTSSTSGSGGAAGASASASSASASASATSSPSRAETAALMKQQRTGVNDFDETTKFKSLYELQGVDFSKLKKSTKTISDEWKDEMIAEVASQGGKRKRISRIVRVDGHDVLTANMYTLEEGEPSVFMREASGHAAAAATRDAMQNSGGGGVNHRRARQLAGRDYENSPVCGVCWEGGELICCDFCPGSFHMECIGLAPEDVSSGPWSCPHHSCSVCNMKATAAGGLLFRCEMCEKAFCEDHLPSEKVIVNKCTRFIDLGQRHPKTACFIHCGNDCIATAERTDRT